MGAWPGDNANSGNGWGVTGPCTADGDVQQVMMICGTTWSADLNMGTVSTAIFRPFVLERPQYAKSAVNAVGSNNDSGTSGFDIGIYTENGTRVCSTGATLQTSVTTTLTTAFTAAVTLAPGFYFLAYVQNNSSLGRPFKGTSVASVIKNRVMGAREMASAYPLPSTATMVACTGTTPPALIIVTSF